MVHFPFISIESEGWPLNEGSNGFFTISDGQSATNVFIDNDFDIDGIATISWSGFASTLIEASQPTRTVFEAINSTNNYIRNRLTQLTITAADPVTFPGNQTTVTGITKANMSDVQQASIGKFERPAKESSRPRSRQFASSLGVAPAVSALHTTRPHTAGGANNARTGHIIKEFFTFDKSRIEPSDHNKIAGKIWIMSELERGQGEFRMTPFFHRDSPSWPMRGVK